MHREGEISFSKHCTQQEVNWRGATIQGEGIQLLIPENAIRRGDSVNIALQACSSRNFKIPDDMVLESPIFHISPPYNFQQKVTLVMEHFASIERSSDCEEFVLLSSPTKSEEAGWNFHPYARPYFTADFKQAKVDLNHFCFTALARKLRIGV